jgi:hypothetical protein
MDLLPKPTRPTVTVVFDLFVFGFGRGAFFQKTFFAHHDGPRLRLLQAAYRLTVDAAAEPAKRCEALAALRDCFVAKAADLSEKDHYLARGFLESLSLFEQCDALDLSAFSVPAKPVAVAEDSEE